MAGADGQNADSITTAVSDALVSVGADLLTAPGLTPEAATKSGASLLVSGSVRRSLDGVRVTARIDRTRNGKTLVSRVFDLPASDAAFASDRVAAWAADMIGSESWILRYERHPDRIAALTKIQVNSPQDNLRAYREMRDLADRSPDSGIVQGAFAAVVPFELSGLPQAERRQAVEAARASARRAQALLPKAGDIYALDCGLKPPGQYIFTKACEDRMERALELDPDAYFLSFAYAAELTETGRFVAAEPLSAKALSLAPYSMDRTALRMQIAWTIPPEYQSQLELQRREAAARREWASPNLIDHVRYQMFLNTGAMDKAEAMLNDPEMSAMIETDEKGPAHLVFRAIRSRKLTEMRAAVDACAPPPPWWLPPDLVFGTCLTGLAALGDLDSVFRLAQLGYGDSLCCSAAQVEQEWLATGGQTYPRQYLFGPVMAKARADARFIDIARRVGLLAYWKSGHPPDFCSFERVPVCEAILAK